MIIGIPRETAPEENRVSVTPAGVEVLRQHGHVVLLEKGAGAASGFDDGLYAHAGAEVLEHWKDVWSRAEMIVRVKAPTPSECALLRPDQIYFSFLHLAAAEELTRTLMRRGAVAIAYETVQKADGTLPLLTPMSEVSGAMAIHEGAKYLEMAHGGHGVLLGGVPGVEPATVLILGGGTVGTRAARIACGLGAKVYVLDVDLERLRHLSDVMPPNCFALMSSPAALRELLPRADVVVGAVLAPGARSPTLIGREMLRTMKKGAVLVDVAIDQGGIAETSRATTHARPTYAVDGVVHYAVENMPGAVPRTATLALTNATLPYVLELADKGWQGALRDNPEIRRGANVVRGRVTHPSVAAALELEHVPVDGLL